MGHWRSCQCNDPRVYVRLGLPLHESTSTQRRTSSPNSRGGSKNMTSQSIYGLLSESRLCRFGSDRVVGDGCLFTMLDHLTFPTSLLDSALIPPLVYRIPSLQNLQNVHPRFIYSSPCRPTLPPHTPAASQSRKRRSTVFLA